MNFSNKHILSIDQFSFEDLHQILSVAATMEPFAGGIRRTRVLEGAILANLFFEPSTRSRVSFGAAFNRLGGSVRDTTGIESSSIVKGESLWDTARVISGYVDAIVMRHPRAGSVAEFSKGSIVPVFNGGDGAGEHPTQALLDLYTLSKELRRSVDELGGIKIAIVGDLKNGRAVHSLVKVLALLKNKLEIICISPAALKLPEELIDATASRGHKIREETELNAGLGDVDVIYATRLQRERFSSPEEAAHFAGMLSLNREQFRTACKPGTVIMHPLPRDSRPDAGELSNDLNSEPELAIFRQTDNGIPVRMALFALALGVEQSVDKYAEDTPWKKQRLA